MGKKRKTREEKVRAELRRLQKKLTEKRPSEEAQTKVKKQKAKISPLQPEPSIQELTYPKAQNYLRADLKKTFVLTLLAIGLELVVYWWLKTK